MDTLTPTTTELLPLFQEWAEIESDRCRLQRGKHNIVTLSLGKGCFPLEVLDISGYGLAVLQAALQEAIAQHEYYLQSEHYNYYADPEVIQHITFENGDKVTGKHSNAAIALLQCYLQALRAARAVA